VCPVSTVVEGGGTGFARAAPSAGLESELVLEGAGGKSVMADISEGYWRRGWEGARVREGERTEKR